MAIVSSELRRDVEAWIAADSEPQTVAELRELLADDAADELAARFAGRLEFGTAGLRGLTGAGPTRMNRRVVRETSAGLAAYVKDNIADAQARGIVVTYDARPDSQQFAHDAAEVFLGAGFQVYLTEENQPTPIGAYAVLVHGAAAGVVVTASHNPPGYNGYKVYWDNGAQIIPPHDAGIAGEIDAVVGQRLPYRAIAQAGGQLHWLGDEFVSRYVTAVQGALEPWGERSLNRRVTVAYTALHGVGGALVETLLAGAGVGACHTVTSQQQPDGEFPTVKFPNPEEPGAMDAVIELAKRHKCTLAIANDPDADRLAVAVLKDCGDYKLLTGDQIGVLLGDYCLRQTQVGQPIICNSLVSSRLLRRIAEAAGAQFHETLTGFKWLANVALQHQDEKHRFLFAYEEALGYALGQIVHDKDGLSALLAFVMLAAEQAERGQTVLDRLAAIYRDHGIFVTAQRSIATRAGAVSLTEQLRAAPPANIGELAVTAMLDLQSGLQVFADGRTEPLTMGHADVLIYLLQDDSRVIVRPSGTEPKTKCYYEVVEFGSDTNLDTMRASAERRLENLIEAHAATLPPL